MNNKLWHAIVDISPGNAHALRAEVATILDLVRLINESVFVDVFDKMILTHLKDTILKLDEVVDKFTEIVNDNGR